MITNPPREVFNLKRYPFVLSRACVSESTRRRGRAIWSGPSVISGVRACSGTQRGKRARAQGRRRENQRDGLLAWRLILQNWTLDVDMSSVTGPGSDIIMAPRTVKTAGAATPVNGPSLLSLPGEQGVYRCPTCSCETPRVKPTPMGSQMRQYASARRGDGAYRGGQKQQDVLISTLYRRKNVGIADKAPLAWPIATIWLTHRDRIWPFCGCPRMRRTNKSHPPSRFGDWRKKQAAPPASKGRCCRPFSAASGTPGYPQSCTGSARQLRKPEPWTGHRICDMPFRRSVRMTDSIPFVPTYGHRAGRGRCDDWLVARGAAW
jgi:hypothetical protein